MVVEYVKNTKMAKVAPELQCEYARYPMHHLRWLKVNEKEGPNGEPLFIPCLPQDAGQKRNYVFGPGPKGFGYYHLLTRSSYLALYARLTHESPVFCCFAFGKKAKQAYADYDEVKRLVYFRSRSRSPDDDQASREATAEGKDHSERTDHASQYEQCTVDTSSSSSISHRSNFKK
jgi:hypothetical protein